MSRLHAQLGFQPRRSGFSLAELMLVVLIIAALATLAVPHLASRWERSRETITMVSLRNIRDVILVDYRNDMYEQLPFPADGSRQQHPQLNYLFVNPDDFAGGPSTQWSFDPAVMRGWAGPYLTDSGRYAIDDDRGFFNSYGEDDDQVPLDAWSNPIVLQQPVADGSGFSATSLLAARLVSAGSNGVIDTPPTELDPTDEHQGDDVVLFFREN